MISRRNVLIGTGLAAASAALVRKRVFADDPPPPALSWPEANFPDGDPTFAPDPSWGGPKKILEIFLVGGLSPFESFFVDRRFMSGGLLTELNSTTIDASCDPSSPSGLRTTVYNDHTPMRMEWSVGTKPLWARADILGRTRVVAMTHGETIFNGHPTARPYALTGRRIGDPRAASLGAAMKRRYPGQHTSYILMPDRSRFFGPDLPGFDAWLATGGHGPGAQPVLVPMGADAAPAVATWASRSTVPGGAANSDTLNGYYLGRYDRDLPHPPDGPTTGHRYRGFEAYRAAYASLHDSPQLTSVFGSPLRTPGATAMDCSNNVTDRATSGLPNTTQSSLAMAAWLFKHRNSRYVGMFDVGIGTDVGSPYDGHSHSAGVTYGNLYRLLSMLSAFIAPPGTVPSDSQISLDDTMILLNTEFGRTPAPGLSPTGDGRDHYGAGYVTLLMGGPIRPTASAQPRLVGDFAASRGTIAEPLRGSFTPANLAWVALAAAGIWPEHPDNFAMHERPGTPAGSLVNPAAQFFNAS